MNTKLPSANRAADGDAPHTRYNLDVTKVIRAHFDGHVIVPETPVDLPRNERLIIHIERDQERSEPQPGTVGYMAEHLKPMSDEDADEMRRAIEEARRNVEPDPGVNFD